MGVMYLLARHSVSVPVMSHWSATTILTWPPMLAVPLTAIQQPKYPFWGLQPQTSSSMRSPKSTTAPTGKSSSARTHPELDRAAEVKPARSKPTGSPATIALFSTKNALPFSRGPI